MKNRLEELRKQRGIKQEDLANALEVSRQTIGSLENGRYNPSIQLAFKIARYFNMSIEEILFTRRIDYEKKVVDFNDSYRNDYSTGRIANIRFGST